MKEYKPNDIVYVLTINLVPFKVTIEPKRILRKGKWPHTYILKDIYSEDLEKGEYGGECFFTNMTEAINQLEKELKQIKKEV